MTVLFFMLWNGDSDANYDIKQDFAWKDIENYEKQRENFVASVKPQSVAEHVTQIVDFLFVFQ
jgi:hypothetical protein